MCKKIHMFDHMYFGFYFLAYVLCVLLLAYVLWVFTSCGLKKVIFGRKTERRGESDRQTPHCTTLKKG